MPGDYQRSHQTEGKTLRLSSSIRAAAGARWRSSSLVVSRPHQDYRAWGLPSCKCDRRDGAGRSEISYVLSAEPKAGQDLVVVVAETGSAAGWYLRAGQDRDRAADGGIEIVHALQRDHDVVVFELRVAGRLLRRLDDPIRDPRLVENLLPVREGLAGECFVEKLCQCARIVRHGLRISETRIFDQVGLADHVCESRPVRW